jgi:hypothetical protein
MGRSRLNDRRDRRLGEQEKSDNDDEDRHTG